MNGNKISPNNSQSIADTKLLPCCLPFATNAHLPPPKNNPLCLIRKSLPVLTILASFDYTEVIWGTGANLVCLDFCVLLWFHFIKQWQTAFLLSGIFTAQCNKSESLWHHRGSDPVTSHSCFLERTYVKPNIHHTSVMVGIPCLVPIQAASFQPVWKSRLPLLLFWHWLQPILDHSGLI